MWQSHCFTQRNHWVMSAQRYEGQGEEVQTSAGKLRENNWDSLKAASLCLKDKATHVSAEAPLHHNTVNVELNTVLVCLTATSSSTSPPAHTNANITKLHFMKHWTPSSSKQDSAQTMVPSESLESARFGKYLADSNLEFWARRN